MDNVTLSSNCPTTNLTVTKTDTVTNVAAGGTITYTQTVTNNGAAVSNATLSDPAVAGLTKTGLGVCTASGGATCPAAGSGAGQLGIANLEAGTVVVPSLPANGSISFTVTATATTTPGSVTNTFTALPPSGTADSNYADNSASDTDTVVAINAVNDSGLTIDSAAGGTSLANVLVNDTLNGSAATTGNVTITAVGTWPTGITLNTTTGAVSVAVGTAYGTYTPQYQICSQAAPAICSTATVTVPVVAISAVADSGTTLNGVNGGISIPNVLTNDTLNGAAATTSNVTITTVGAWPSGITLSTATGAVSVAAGTTAGTYTPQYMICSQANPSVCDTAMVTVPVVTVDAVNDSGTPLAGAVGGTSLANVLVNDTLNGSAATTSNVTITAVGTWPTGVTLNTTTGAVSVAPGTAANTYTPQYQICSQTNPTICDTATVTVPVYAPPTVAKSFTPAAIAVGGTSSMQIVVTNPASNPGNLTGVSISDSYAGTLKNNAAGSVVCSGAGSATLTGGVNNGTTVGFNAGTIVPGGTCTITQSVTATSTNLNTTGMPASTGPIALTGTAANATLTMLVPPTISKAFTASNIASGGNTSLTVTIGNSNASAISLTGILTDTLPTGMTILTPGGNSGTCTGCNCHSQCSQFQHGQWDLHPGGRVHRDRECDQQYGWSSNEHDRGGRFANLGRQQCQCNQFYFERLRASDSDEELYARLDTCGRDIFDADRGHEPGE